MKFKKSQLKKIIAEELSKSAALKTFLRERGEIDPTTLKKNPKGSKQPYSAMATVYGTELDHYIDSEDRQAFARGEAPGRQQEIQIGYDGKKKALAPKLSLDYDDEMFNRGDLTDRQINAMFNRNTPAPSPGELSSDVTARAPTKRAMFMDAMGSLQIALAMCENCEAEGMDECAAEIQNAMDILAGLRTGF